MENDSIIRINHIIDNLYASSKEIAEDINILEQNNITTIISLNNQSFEYPLTMSHYRFDTEDNPNFNIKEYYDLIYNIIIKSNNVLVHCDAGVSRTGSIIIYYLMSKYNISYDEALEYALSKRPSISPNNGFELGLRLLNLNYHKSETNHNLITQGIHFIYFNQLVDFLNHNMVRFVIGVGNGMNYGDYCFMVDDNIDDILENYKMIKEHIMDGNVIYGTKYLIDMIKNIHYNTFTNLTNEEYDKIYRIYDTHNIHTKTIKDKFSIIDIDLDSLLNYKKSDLIQLYSRIDVFVCKTNEERIHKKNLINFLEGMI
jgi:hypothetical protein